MVNPYGEFWSDADEEQVALQGKPQSEYFDFYTVEEDGVNYVFFSDICTGLKVSSLANDDPEDWTATMIYQHLSNGAERLADDAYACNSKQVGDGVFHLAPWNFIYGTNYYYSWYQYDSDVAYVVLPGHSLDELSGAPRLLKAKGGISNTLSTTPKQVRNN